MSNEKQPKDAKQFFKEINEASKPIPSYINGGSVSLSKMIADEKGKEVSESDILKKEKAQLVSRIEELEISNRHLITLNEELSTENDKLVDLNSNLRISALKMSKRYELLDIEYKYATNSWWFNLFTKLGL